MQNLSLLSFIFFSLLIMLITWLKTKNQNINSANSLFFANKNLGFFMVGGALFFTNINAVQFIGENESVYLNNMSVMAWGMTSVLALIIVAEFIMPIYLRAGISTIPDFLAIRYDESIKRWVSNIFLFSYIFNLLPVVLYSGAVAFNGLFDISGILGISYWHSILLLTTTIGTLGFIYTMYGGMKIMAISDTLLGIGMFIGGIVLLYYAFTYLGKGDFNIGVHTVLFSKREHLNSIGSSLDAIPFSTLFTGMILMNLYYWGTEQYIIQQALSAKDLASSQKGIAVTCLGKIVSPIVINIPGLIAVHLYNNYENTPEIFSRLVRDVSPPILTGFMATIVFGAALTTFHAGLNSANTLFFTKYENALSNEDNERQQILMKKTMLFSILICITAMIIAPALVFVKSGFYTYLQSVGGYFSVPIFTIVIIGMVSKSVPSIAAKIGLVFFIISYACTQMLFDINLHFLHILFILFCVTCILMLIIGKVYPLKEPYVLKLSNHVSLQPWKHRFFYYSILLLLMVGMFILFSPWGLG